MDIIEAVVFLVLYVVVAAGVSLVAWRLSQRISTPVIRVAVRALVIAFLFAPGFFACGGVSIAPFAMIVVTDIYALLTQPASNGCGPYYVWPNMQFFLVTLAIVLGFLVALALWRSRNKAES